VQRRDRRACRGVEPNARRQGATPSRASAERAGRPDPDTRERCPQVEKRHRSLTARLRIWASGRILQGSKRARGHGWAMADPSPGSSSRLVDHRQVSPSEPLRATGGVEHRSGAPLVPPPWRTVPAPQPTGFSQVSSSPRRVAEAEEGPSCPLNAPNRVRGGRRRAGAREQRVQAPPRRPLPVVSEASSGGAPSSGERRGTERSAKQVYDPMDPTQWAGPGWSGNGT
jgi:hypothetical protein